MDKTSRHSRNTAITTTDTEEVTGQVFRAQQSIRVERAIPSPEEIIDVIDNLMFYDCKVDIEGNAQYYFCKPTDTAIYYISCLFDKAEATVDKVIFKLTTEQ